MDKSSTGRPPELKGETVKQIATTYAQLLYCSQLQEMKPPDQTDVAEVYQVHRITLARYIQDQGGSWSDIKDEGKRIARKMKSTAKFPQIIKKRYGKFD